MTSTTTPRKRRGASEDDPWGWFEELEGAPATGHESEVDSVIKRALSLPAARTEVPPYILEESISTQQLWHSTAGRRPRQPTPEREAFERLLEQNFNNSEVDYTRQSSSGSDSQLSSHKSGQDLEVLYRGISPFGTGVSKSFHGAEIHVITLQLSRFRVVRSGEDLHAEFLVIISFGNATYGIWKRHTDFKRLADKLQTQYPNQFRNTLLSWKCLIHRQRWFRCLEKDYLALKCFLLERFMHDLLFESKSPDIITDFLISQ